MTRQSTATVKLKTAAATATGTSEDDQETETVTCSLCHCGDKCLLGQGDLLRFEASEPAALLNALKLVQRRLHQQTSAGSSRNENEKFLTDCLVGYLESLSGDDLLAHYLNKNANLANLFK